MSAEFGEIVDSIDLGPSLHATYVRFDNKPIVPGGVTLGGLLNGAAEGHNNGHDFGINHVRTNDIRGDAVEGQVGRRTFVRGREVKIGDGQVLRVLTGSKEAVSTVIGTARHRASQLQASSLRKA